MIKYVSISVAAIVLSSFAGLGHTLVLWQVENPLSPTMVPAYRGQPSPFPHPKIVASDVAVEDEAAITNALRVKALQEAKNMVKPTVALSLKSMSGMIKGVSDGLQGRRVLVGNEWIGLKEKISVTYIINPRTIEALKILSQYDYQTADSMQRKLMKNKTDWEEQGVTIQAINVRNRQVTIATPEGTMQIPFYLEP